MSVKSKRTFWGTVEEFEWVLDLALIVCLAIGTGLMLALWAVILVAVL